MKKKSLILLFLTSTIATFCETPQETFDRGKEAIAKITEKQQKLKMQVEILEREEERDKQKHEQEFEVEVALRELLGKDAMLKGDVLAEMYQRALELKEIEEVRIHKLKYGKGDSETSVAVWFVGGLGFVAFSVLGVWFLGIRGERDGYAALTR